MLIFFEGDGARNDTILSLGISLYPIHNLGLAGEFCCNFLPFSFILLNMEGVSFFFFSVLFQSSIFTGSLYILFLKMKQY